MIETEYVGKTETEGKIQDAVIYISFHKDDIDWDKDNIGYLVIPQTAPEKKENNTNT